MKKFLRWFLLNLFTIGTLTLGYYTGEMGLTGSLIGIYEFVILFLLFTVLLVSMSDSEKEAIVKLKRDIGTKDGYKFTWKVLFEPFLMFWVYKMGYSKLTILMFLTLIVGSALTFRHYSLKKEYKEKTGKG